nr:hypothetical protein BaRGS_014136 [Batillaria attramentaria]
MRSPESVVMELLQHGDASGKDAASVVVAGVDVVVLYYVWYPVVCRVVSRRVMYDLSRRSLQSFLQQLEHDGIDWGILLALTLAH